MATSREQVIMALATDLKDWPKVPTPFQSMPSPGRFSGWTWHAITGGRNPSYLEIIISSDDDSQPSIQQIHWEAEIERLSSPHPAIKWKEGDICTAGTIAYVSTEHHNVMVRGTHSMMEVDGRSLERKLTKERFIAQKLAFYLGDMSRTEAFEKIIVDAEIDWEDE